MNMTEPLLLLIVMMAIVAVASVFFKSRMTWVTPVVFLACAVVSLVAGMGIKIREIVEGPFVYLDSSMQILTGAAFCYLMYKNGTFEFLFNKIIAKKRGGFVQMLLLVLFIGLPGMISGSALVCVATTGMMAGKYLLDKGVDKAKVVEVVAVASVLGMLMPPLSAPAMMTTIARQGGYPGSFEGFFVPLLIATLPILIVYCIMAGGRILGDVEAAEVEKKGGALCLVPLLVAFVLVICHNFTYSVTPFLGYPLIYTICFVLALVLKVESANPLTSAAEGVRAAAVEVAAMCAFASVTEILTVVGTNGTVAAWYSINEPNLNVYVLGLMAVVLVLGYVLGPVMGITFAGFAVYVISVAVSNDGIVMLGMAMVLALAFLISLRGGIVEQTGEALGVSGVSSKTVFGKVLIPAILMLVMAVVFFVSRASLAGLMM